MQNGINGVMLCCVMLCHVMSCHFMLCYVMLCYVMLCYVMLCYVEFNGLLGLIPDNAFIQLPKNTVQLSNFLLTLQEHVPLMLPLWRP